MKPVQEFLKQRYIKQKISNSLNKKVFVYFNSTPTTLSHEFGSCTEVVQYFSSSIGTISNYLKSG